MKNVIKIRNCHITAVSMVMIVESELKILSILSVCLKAASKTMTIRSLLAKLYGPLTYYDIDIAILPYMNVISSQFSVSEM
jgi:hypothetical protein